MLKQVSNQDLSRGREPRSESGFSLIELIVSIAIFLIVTGAVFSVASVARQSRGTVNKEVEMSKTVRVGMNLLGRDTHNAGYGYPLKSAVVLPDNKITLLLGIPNDFDTTRDTVPPIIAGNDITTNTFNTTPGVKTDQVTFLFKDPSFNLIGTDPNKIATPLSINAATTNGSGIDEIVPLSGSNAACRVRDLYLVTGNTGSTLGVVTAKPASTNKIQFANGDPLGFNLSGTGGNIRGITIPASLTRVLMVTYFVTADGTLTRREYVNTPPPATGAYVDEPLVYGVENFQIKYVMDDGRVLDNPAAGPDGIIGNADDAESLLEGVRQIRFTINVRSIDGVGTGQDHRETLTSIFSTRNLGYDAY